MRRAQQDAIRDELQWRGSVQSGSLHDVLFAALFLFVCLVCWNFTLVPLPVSWFFLLLSAVFVLSVLLRRGGMAPQLSLPQDLFKLSEDQKALLGMSVSASGARGVGAGVGGAEGAGAAVGGGGGDDGGKPGSKGPYSALRTQSDWAQASQRRLQQQEVAPRDSGGLAGVLFARGAAAANTLSEVSASVLSPIIRMTEPAAGGGGSAPSRLVNTRRAAGVAFRQQQSQQTQQQAQQAKAAQREYLSPSQLGFDTRSPSRWSSSQRSTFFNRVMSPNVDKVLGEENAAQWASPGPAPATSPAAVAAANTATAALGGAVTGGAVGGGGGGGPAGNRGARTVGGMRRDGAGNRPSRYNPASKRLDSPFSGTDTVYKVVPGRSTTRRRGGSSGRGGGVGDFGLSGAGGGGSGGGGRGSSWDGGSGGSGDFGGVGGGGGGGRAFRLADDVDVDAGGDDGRDDSDWYDGLGSDGTLGIMASGRRHRRKRASETSADNIANAQAARNVLTQLNIEHAMEDYIDGAKEILGRYLQDTMERLNWLIDELVARGLSRALLEGRELRQEMLALPNWQPRWHLDIDQAVLACLEYPNREYFAALLPPVGQIDLVVEFARHLPVFFIDEHHRDAAGYCLHRLRTLATMQRLSDIVWDGGEGMDEWGDDRAGLGLRTGFAGGPSSAAAASGRPSGLLPTATAAAAAVGSSMSSWLANSMLRRESTTGGTVPGGAAGGGTGNIWGLGGYGPGAGGGPSVSSIYDVGAGVGTRGPQHHQQQQQQLLWQPGLPTDTDLLVNLFCHLVDEELGSSPALPGNVNFTADALRPFKSLYFVSGCAALRSADRTRPRVLLAKAASYPPYYCVLTDHQKWDAAPGRQNCFAAIALFLWAIEHLCGGTIEQSTGGIVNLETSVLGQILTETSQTDPTYFEDDS